jgi:hypothetical protein
MFKRTIEGLEVKESRVAAWSKMKVSGLFLKKGYRKRKGMVIGIYGGKMTIGIGPYVLELMYEDGEKFRVDSEGAEDGFRLFGMMNEDIHEGKVNAHLEEMGLIKAVSNMIGPCEILTNYGEEYDWDEIKWIGYRALKEDMRGVEEWVSGLKAKNMKEARKGCRLERYMARIVDGEIDAEELHSTRQTDGMKTLETFLTSGEEMEWYCFGNFGGEKKRYEWIDIGRMEKRVSGVKRYAQKWLEEEVITCEFKEVRRLNENVNTTCNMIEESRITMSMAKKGDRKEVRQRDKEGDGKEGNQLETYQSGIEEAKITNSEGGGEGERGPKSEKKENKHEEAKKSDPGIKGGSEATEMSGKYGRVKVSLAMGSGRKRLEHLRIINRCNSIGELNEKTALLRIWRVEIMQQENEDKVDGDGFCGYAAMTNIINGIDRRLSMKRRQDRLEVGMAIRNMIAKGKGSMRKE